MLSGQTPGPSGQADKDPSPFEVVAKQKPPPPTAYSHDTLRILAAADDDVFSFPDTEEKLDRDRRASVQRTISESDSPFADLSHHRLMPVLDSLASLLVSQSRGEEVAVGYVPTEDDRIVLCLGENGSPDHLAAAENHLRDMWRVLQEIRAQMDQTNCEKTPEESNLPPGLTSELYQICHTFSRDRTKRHYDKAVKSNMLDALVNALANKKKEEEQDPDPDPVPPSPGKKQRRLPPKIKPSAVLSDVQWQLVEALKDVLEKYAEYAFHGGKAKPWMMACSHANELVRALKNRLEFLDELLWQHVPQHSRGDRYQRLAEKLLVVDASIRQLLILPYSVSFGEALDRPILDVLRAPSEVNHLTYNFRSDGLILGLVNKKRSITSQDFLKRIAPQGNNRVQKTAWALNVHAESAILSYFADEKILAYHYIGVSRLSCVGCWYFFEAYNDAAKELKLNPYYTRGSHTKVYPWVPPKPNTNKFILDRMKPKVETFFNKLVGRDRLRPRTLSESSAASVSAYGVNVDWDASGEMDIPPPNA